MTQIVFERQEAERIAKAALGIEWRDTESAARRVAEHAAAYALTAKRQLEAAERMIIAWRGSPTGSQNCPATLAMEDAVYDYEAAKGGGE